MTCDLLVLGSGPAGYYAALSCARAGLSTALAERAELGGTGFRWGCLPVKMVLDDLRGSARPSASRRRLARARARLPGVEQRLEQNLQAAGVTLLRGETAFLDPNTVAVAGERVQARSIVIATGTRPAAPAGIELDGRMVISHADLFRATRPPRSVAVVGADVEGVELACLLAGCGARVHLLEQKPEILPGQDRDLAGPVQERLACLGVRFRLGAAAAAVRRRPGNAVIEFTDGGSVSAERVLATGLRKPNLPAGLEKAGVACDAARIPVDGHFRTSASHIYAIGDVNGRCGLANAAILQGLLLPGALRGEPPASADYPSPPRALFTVPEIAGAGLQERELEARGLPFRAATVRLADTWRGLSHGLREGFLKALAAPDGRLLGIWVCAENASELAAPYGALLARGATVEEVRRSLFIHPTLAEALLEAVRLL